MSRCGPVALGGIFCAKIGNPAVLWSFPRFWRRDPTSGDSRAPPARKTVKTNSFLMILGKQLTQFPDFLHRGHVFVQKSVDFHFPWNPSKRLPSAELQKHSCGGRKTPVTLFPVSTLPQKPLKSHFSRPRTLKSDLWGPGAHFSARFRTLAARCRNDKEFQRFSMVPGGTFSLFVAKGAFLAPKRCPRARKAVREGKIWFLSPGRASAPTRHQFEAAFPMVCALVPQRVQKREFPSKL